jgi:actin-related protein 6
MIEAIQNIWAAEYLTLGFGILPDEFRVYPTDSKTPIPVSEAQALLAEAHHHHHHNSTRNCDDDDENDEKGDIQLVGQEWRINLDIVLLGGSLMSDLPGQNTATQYCGSWQTVDWMTYGGISLDKIVFVVDKRSGDVLGVEVPTLRGGLLTR